MRKITGAPSSLIDGVVDAQNERQSAFDEEMAATLS